MDPLLLNVISANLLIEQTNKKKRNILYLDVCEVLQINPLLMHEESFILKRIKQARAYYNEARIEMLLFKIKRKEIKSELYQEHGRKSGRRHYQKFIEDYKNEKDYVDAAVKSVFAAEMFFETLTQTEYEEFHKQFLKEAKRKRFKPLLITINEKWEKKVS